jgi:hypothetical protein
MCGLPTQYGLIHPDYVLFVDETGKNTKQKTDSHIGGQKFVVSVGFNGSSESLGATTVFHLHFFTSQRQLAIQLCVL